MSKINNMAGITAEQREEALSKLFANMPDEADLKVELPSKGKFYKDFQEVIVKPLLFEDEQRILNNKEPANSIFNQIIAKSIEGVDPYDLVLFDKLFLLMKVREVSYGADYTFEIACRACGSNTKVSLDVSKDLNVYYVEDDLEDPREIQLPKLKVKAGVRLPRVRDEKFLDNLESAISNLYRFVTHIDGNEDPAFISKAIKRMHIMDVKKITQEINKSNYGLDPGVLFECPSCGHKENINIPLDSNFFSVS